MDAIIKTLNGETDTSDTLFSSVSGRHDLILYNNTDTLSAAVYIKAVEGTSQLTTVLQKVRLQPHKDHKYHGSIGDDDSIVVQCVNEHLDMSLLTQSGESLVTQDSEQLGEPNPITVNISYRTRG